MWKRLLGISVGTMLFASVVVHPQVRPGNYENSLVIAPHYVEFLTDSDERFSHQASELKRRLGTASHVLLGFAASLPIQFPAASLDHPITREEMSTTLDALDRIVNRAVSNHLVVHISLGSGFFHGTNDLRPSVIRQDVRNAQWFSDGWIADPSLLTSASVVPPEVWITPSRYAKPLRARMEEGVRAIGSQLAGRMAQYPETLLTISGDGEVELNYERTIAQGEHVIGKGEPIYADYSPFMVEEFRDWIQHSRYEGDQSPSTDENKDGRTFNRDFRQSFSTWRLRYFDSSGPIPFSDYLAMTEKLPSSGRYFVDGGFDAPRMPRPGDPFWNLWIQFRKQAVANYVHDFASWITTSREQQGEFTVPSSRFYSHQIPADFLFGETDGLRLKTSASSIDTAFISPIGSTGVTVFNAFDGKSHKKTGTAALFEKLSMSSASWGILEYNPSMPVGSATGPSADITYYLQELRTLNTYRPHVIVPFAWTDIDFQKTLNIQNSVFEAALKRFIAEVGNSPWVSRKNSAR